MRKCVTHSKDVCKDKQISCLQFCLNFSLSTIWLGHRSIVSQLKLTFYRFWWANSIYFFSDSIQSILDNNCRSARYSSLTPMEGKGWTQILDTRKSNKLLHWIQWHSYATVRSRQEIQTDRQCVCAAWTTGRGRWEKQDLSRERRKTSEEKAGKTEVTGEKREVTVSPAKLFQEFSSEEEVFGRSYEETSRSETCKTSAG